MKILVTKGEGIDRRMQYTANKLNKTFETTFCETIPSTTEVKFDAIVFPLFYSGKKEELSKLKGILKENGEIFCGKTYNILKPFCEENGYKLTDYYEKEEFALRNAIPTAEGTLSILLTQTTKCIFKDEAIIFGYGRTAQPIANMLTALGAKVTIFTRSAATAANAEIHNYSVIRKGMYSKDYLAPYNIIINTVPEPVIFQKDFKYIKEKAVIIDIASQSGIEGLSKDCFEKYGDYLLYKKDDIKVIWALSIPGKFSPEAAGEIIADTVCFSILDNECKQ